MLSALVIDPWDRRQGWHLKEPPRRSHGIETSLTQETTCGRAGFSRGCKAGSRIAAVRIL